MQNFDWEKFHDWNIGEIAINWEKGIFTIRLYLEKEAKIEVSDLKNFFISRDLPWGMSPYVNRIICENKEFWQIEIETQSGDKISVEGGEISIQE